MTSIENDESYNRRVSGLLTTAPRDFADWFYGFVGLVSSMRELVLQAIRTARVLDDEVVRVLDAQVVLDSKLKQTVQTAAYELGNSIMVYGPPTIATYVYKVNNFRNFGVTHYDGLPYPLPATLNPVIPMTYPTFLGNAIMFLIRHQSPATISGTSAVWTTVYTGNGTEGNPFVLTLTRLTTASTPMAVAMSSLVPVGLSVGPAGGVALISITRNVGTSGFIITDDGGTSTLTSFPATLFISSRTNNNFLNFGNTGVVGDAYVITFIHLHQRTNHALLSINPSLTADRL